MRIHTRNFHGFTQIELLATICASLLVIAVIVPMFAAGRSRARELVSLANLKTLASAHAAYAADWSDKQFTHCPENMGQTDGTFSSYYSQFGCPPPVILGFGGPVGQPSSGVWGFYLPPPCTSVGMSGNISVLWPMPLETPSNIDLIGFGMHRLCNAVGFNEYVNGRFMDPTFYAPSDRTALGCIGPGLESANPFTLVGGYLQSWTTSYQLSAAAMYHPEVFGGGASGAFVPPIGFASSTVSPTVSQCAYPELKSRMTEVRWLQSPPATTPGDLFRVIPFFNAGADSVPMTLYFDGHVSGMPIRKVLADNASVVNSGGAKLWMDTDITVGPWASYEGYYSTSAVDDTRTSVHVFTRKGILGRDVLTPDPE